MEETADIADKDCAICYKGGYDFEKLSDHYFKVHDLHLNDSIPSWQWFDAQLTSSMMAKRQEIIYTKNLCYGNISNRLENVTITWKTIY